jgi:predicted transcriptional regulator
LGYRSKTDIIAEILRAATGGETTRTKLMYKAFLSYAQLKEYVAVLVDNGLLDYDTTAQTYGITEKGFRFLAIFEHLQELVKYPI